METSERCLHLKVFQMCICFILFIRYKRRINGLLTFGRGDGFNYGWKRK